MNFMQNVTDAWHFNNSPLFAFFCVRVAEQQ